MTSVPESTSGRKLGAGPTLVGFGALLFVVTRVIRWLPLGFVGTWINGFLWPVLILSVLAGGGLMYLKYKRSA